MGEVYYSVLETCLTMWKMQIGHYSILETKGFCHTMWKMQVGHYSILETKGFCLTMWKMQVVHYSVHDRAKNDKCIDVHIYLLNGSFLG